MSVSEITETRQYLTFRWATKSSRPMSQVREVLDLTTITRFAHPEFMSGVINLRAACAVVDLRLCSNVEDGKHAQHLHRGGEVLLDNEPTVIGALADSVEEVIDLEPDQIEPAPRIGTRSGRSSSAAWASGTRSSS